MKKFKTEKLSFDGAEKKELQFSIDISINNDGVFTTQLPENITQLFENAGIQMGKNLRGRNGYFQDKSYDNLILSVSAAAKTYLSEELIEEKTVIRYIVRTTCSYMLKDDDVTPNGYWAGKDGGHWREGTISQNASSRHPFGLLIWVEPKVKKTFKYKTGRTRIQYGHTRYHMENRNPGDPDYNLCWLASICSMSEPESGTKQEVDYTEEVAAVFVGMVKWICFMNEKIKDFLTPEGIQQIAAAGGGQKLLT
jgi:hypothetical protein